MQLLHVYWTVQYVVRVQQHHHMVHLNVMNVVKMLIPILNVQHVYVSRTVDYNTRHYLTVAVVVMAIVIGSIGYFAAEADADTGTIRCDPCPRGGLCDEVGITYLTLEAKSGTVHDLS
jgi:hypothetical protein